MAEETTQNPPIKFERDDDFVSLYANHIWYETSVWDLKLIFGLLDQTRGPDVVTQHTAVSLAWSQVKMLSYFLQINLALYESRNGKIKVPASVLPTEPPPPPPEVEDNPDVKATADKIREIYARFIESL